MYCRRKYSPDDKTKTYPESLRQQAVEMYLQGVNFRRIARRLKVAPRIVAYWITQRAEFMPDAFPEVVIKAMLEQKNKEGLHLQDDDPKDTWDPDYWNFRNIGKILADLPRPKKLSGWINLLLPILVTLAAGVAFIIFLKGLIDLEEPFFIIPVAFFGGFTIILILYIVKDLPRRAPPGTDEPQPVIPDNPARKKKKPRPIQHRKDYH
jgi:hypothetical protein